MDTIDLFNKEQSLKGINYALQCILKELQEDGKWREKCVKMFCDEEKPGEPDGKEWEEMKK